MGLRALAPPLCHSPAQPSSAWASFLDRLSSWSQDGCSSSSHCISTQPHSKAEKGPLFPRAFLRTEKLSQKPAADIYRHCYVLCGGSRGGKRAELWGGNNASPPLSLGPYSPRAPSPSPSRRDPPPCTLAHPLKRSNHTCEWENQEFTLSL